MLHLTENLTSMRNYLRRELNLQENILSVNLKRLKYADIEKEGFVESKATAEDWEGFKTEVSGSTIEDKDLILRVLSMYSDPVVREREIKNMSSAYEVLKDDILPRLRRSKLIVNVNKIGRTDEEILEAIKSDPTQLNIEELLYAGTLTDDVEEQI